MTQHVCDCPVEECCAKSAFRTNPKNVNIMFIDMYCQYIDNMPLYANGTIKKLFVVCKIKEIIHVRFLINCDLYSKNCK